MSIFDFLRKQKHNKPISDNPLNQTAAPQAQDSQLTEEQQLAKKQKDDLEKLMAFENKIGAADSYNNSFEQSDKQEKTQQDLALEIRNPFRGE